MKKSILIFFLFHFQQTFCQYIDIASIQNNWISVAKQAYYSNDYQNGDKQIVPFAFAKSITAKNYYRKHMLFLYLKNSSALPDSVRFFCGHWVKYTAFRVSGGIRTNLVVEQKFNAAIGQKLPMLHIVVPANDSIIVEIQPDVRNFNYNYVQPFIIRDHSLNEFGYAYYLDEQKTFLIISFLFLGILLVMFIYAMISWNREQNKDYLFYGIYVLFFILYFTVRIGTMFLTAYSILQHNLYAIHFFQIFGYIFYAFFLISFLHLKREIPLLYNILKGFAYLMVLYLFIDALLIYSTTAVQFSIFLFTMIRYALLLLSVVTVFILFQQKKRISNYIAYGILFLSVFGLVSLLFTPVQLGASRFHNFFDMRIPFYQSGIFIELIFFTMGLQYKTNLKNKKNILFLESIKIETEKKEFESLMMVMEAKDIERSRIAQEIHDDIGSGLTNIRLLSEIAKQKNSEMQLVEIDKISATASELIDNMNEIIWSMNAKNDQLTNLLAYIRRFVVTYFENIESIKVATNLPDQIPDLQISGAFRRSVFLVVKESLHNIVKHAKATKIHLEVFTGDNILKISITDNGKGIDYKSISQFSNGLKNMRDRVEEFGGSFSITGVDGTKVQMLLPLNTTT